MPRMDDIVNKYARLLIRPHENEIARPQTESEKIRFRARENNYSELDPSFLSEGYRSERHDFNSELHLPKFSVYPFFGKNKFSIFCERLDSDSHSISCYVGIGFGIYRCRERQGKIFTEFDRLPKIFEEPLKNGIHLTWNKLDEIYARKGEDFTDKEDMESFMTSELNNAIPVGSRKKMEEAIDIFGKENLYFIAETPEEVWYRVGTPLQLAQNPLVVGVSGRDCYLVDFFETPSCY